MNRRNFIQSLLMGVVAPAFLPGANRQWKRSGELLVPTLDGWFKSQIDMKALRVPDMSLYSLVLRLERERTEIGNAIAESLCFGESLRSTLDSQIAQRDSN